MISEGDYVVVRYIIKATHAGPGLGTSTGKKVELSAIIIHGLAGGKMRECWVELDNLHCQQ